MAGSTQDSLNTAVAMVRQIDGRLKKFEKDHADVTEGLQGGIDDESKEELELWRPKLDDVITEIDQMLDACRQGLDATSKVNVDKEFMKTRFEPVQKLVKHLATTQKKFAGWAKDARKLGDDADKALKSVAKSLDEAEAALGTMKNRVSKLREHTDKFETDLAKWTKVALEATRKGDDKTAEPARLAIFDEVKKWKPIATRVRADFEKLKKDFPELPDDMSAEVTRMGDSLATSEDLLASAETSFVQLIEFKKKTMASKAATPSVIPQAQVQKVAPIVGVDLKDSDSMRLLGRILNTVPHEKWAEQIMKQLKKTNGKDMVIKIDKLPYFHARGH